MLRMFLVCLLFAPTSVVHAQTAPSPVEIAAYEGLHRAAHDGNVEETHRLITSGADVNGRDRNGRTPAHVAAFASNDEVLRALAAARANMNALDNQAYDIVTIAAVADDPELMSLAIELGNNPRLTTSPYRGTALIAAAHLGRVEAVRRLIAWSPNVVRVSVLTW